ncbi:MAG: large subunit ribosomal protein L25 [Candidatus Saganbacteria bacterium]|uniref:Large ribosomal subunit protein bL25 n=1 Tax=Candidatus Saganbacteria bacterium TaxID=2575572 RepID=A0A833L0H7_UNCSA|nr:MAG: large subunit ribosomal protein L25 [Candidatus Saganbacteria bacterium]
MEKVDIEATERKNLGRKSKTSRLLGAIPAIVYGRDMQSIPIEVNDKNFNKLIGGASGRNLLINLNIGSASLPVMAHEFQVDPMTGKIIHIDFLKISMDEAIKTKVAFMVCGESEGVKLDGGILVHPLREIEVKCLPSNIPDKIEYDISNLKIGDTIHVSDLKPINGVEFLTSAQEIIITISAPTKEEVAPVEAAVAPVAEAGAPAAPGAAPGTAPAQPVAAEAPKAEKAKPEKTKK